MRLSDLEELLGAGGYATPWSTDEVRDTLRCLWEADLVPAEMAAWGSAVDPDFVAAALIGLSAATAEGAVDEVEYFGAFKPASAAPFAELRDVDLRGALGKILASPVNAARVVDVALHQPPRSRAVIRFVSGRGADPIAMIFTPGGHPPQADQSGAWRLIVYDGALLAHLASALEEKRLLNEPETVEHSAEQDAGWTDDLPDIHPLRRVLGGGRKRRR